MKIQILLDDETGDIEETLDVASVADAARWLSEKGFTYNPHGHFVKQGTVALILEDNEVLLPEELPVPYVG